MTRMFLKVFALILLSGCSLTKKEAFNLKYNERRVIDTFEKVPLYSINSDGSFNCDDYTVFEFDGDLLVAQFERRAKTHYTSTEKYAVEIIEDVSPLEGLYRLHGSGSYGGKYVGITAITNGGGSYAKLALGDDREGLLEQSREIVYWQYASYPLVGRAFNSFTNNEVIVRLNENDLKYHVQTTTNAVFKTDASGTVPEKIYFTNVQPDPANPHAPTKTELGSVTVTGVQLFPPSIEVYSLQDGKFFGIEYHTNTQLEKLQMRFAHESTLDGVLSHLQKRSADYDWESEKTADIPHRVLSLVAGNPIVTLSPYSANPIGSSTTPIIIQAAYDWENTTQYDFDLDSMTAEVITVYDKITNVSAYKVRMISDLSETKGVIQFTGRGVLNQQYGLLEITNKASLAGYLVLAMSENDLTAAGAVKAPVQDKVIAQQPHRVVIEMQRRGKSWVGVQDSGIYSMTNTTNWTFDSEKLLVQAKIMTNTTPKTSTYKIKMLNNFSDNRGSFKLLTTTETIPGLTADTDSKAFENYVLAVKLGSGVDNVRAMLEINESQAKAEELLEKRVVWNLYEQSAVPSGNRIIKTLASINPWIKLSSSGYYTETETEVWWFDPDAMSAVVMEISNNGGNVTTNGASYEVEMAIDLGTVEGGFKLKNPTPIDQDYPNVTTPNNALILNTTFQDKFMYVLTGTAVNASKAYIGIGDTIDEAKANKPSVKNNYHTLDNAPLSAITIEAAVDNAKNKGHKYVALQAPAAASTGSYLPYDTEEFIFSADPLQVEITVITADNTRKKETHPIQIVRAINSTEAIFKYLGTGSLAGKFAGFRVQEASGSVPGTHLIITNADSLADAESELQKLKIANQWTHDLKEERLVPDTNFNNNLGPWGAVDLALESSGTTYDHLLYDYHNTTNFTFDTTTKTIKVDLINRDITNSSTYEYEVMSQEEVVSPQKHTTIVRLTGDGAWNTRYLGVERLSHILDSKAFKYSKIIMSDTYGDTVTALTTAAANYYEVSALDFPKNAIQRADGDAASGAIGDTLVMVDDKGIWNADNTQELRFRSSDMTVNISDVDATGTRSHRYNIIVERTTTAPVNVTDEAEAILYLKSFENNDTAKLHKKFVKMKVESGSTPKKVRFVTADNKSDVETAFTALNGQPNQWNFQDRTSTAIDVRVIATAGDKIWTKLASNLYYWDSEQVEQWAFDAAMKTVRIVSTNGSVIKTENYRIGMKESISATEGIFLLAGSTASDTMYNGHMAYLGFGTGVNDRDANGLLLTTSVGDEATRIAHLKSEAQKMNAAHNWNLREKSLAELSNRAIANAAKVAEWRSLEDKSTAGTLKYDNNNYTSLKISADTANNKLTNVVIQKVGTGAKGPITFQHKMHQDVSDYRGIFQLYNGNDAEYTNKYMAIELGTAVNDRLLKVGIGDTPLDAQNKLNEQTIWNYMDKNMAVADDRIVQEAVSRGSHIWISYRDNPVVGAGDNPLYTSANSTNLMFIRDNQTLKMQYITTTGSVTTTLEFVYGYTMIEDESALKGVFKLSGFGSFADMFVAGELGTAGTSESNRARIAFGTDTEESKQALAATNAQDLWNIFERKSLLLGAQVITTAQARATLVSLDDNELYDPRNTKEFVFNNDPSALNPSVQVTTLIRDVPAQYRYDIEMLEDTSTDEGYFRLDNQGSPDHNKFYGLKFNSGSGAPDKAQLVEGTSLVDVKNKLAALGNKYTVREKTTVPSALNFITKAQEAVEFVSLTSNKVYVPVHTDTIKFDEATRTMNVISLDTNKATLSHNYYLLLVSNTTDTSAWFNLKSDGTTATHPWHGKYIYLTSTAVGNKMGEIRMGMGDTMAAAQSDYNDNHTVSGYTYRAYENVKWVRRDVVDIPSDVLELLVKDNKTIAAVRGGYYHPNENESWTFDPTHRKLTINERGSRTEREAYFMMDYNNTTSLHTRIKVNAYPSIMTTVPAQYFHMILDIRPEFRKKYFVKMNYAADVDSASNGAEHWKLPIMRNRDIAILSTRILTNMGADIDYRPIDVDGQRIAGYGYKVVSINSNMGAVGSGSADPTVRDNLHIEVGDALVTDTINNKQQYVSVIMQDLGANDAVVMLERRDGADNSPLTNTFLAIRRGVDADEKRLKVASGVTAQEALDNLAVLNYWNYIDNSVLNIDNNLITLLFATGKTWVQTQGSAYNANNTTNWIFNPTARSLNIYYISGNGMQTNTETYAYTMIEKTSDTDGIFQLRGYGVYNYKFVKLTRNNANVRFAVGTTIAAAKASHAALTTDNLKEQSSIMPGHQLITKAIGYGLLAGLDSRGLHDPQNTTNMQFQNNSGDLQVIITEYRNGVPIPNSYGIEMIQDSLTDGKFILRGYGTLANKFARLKHLDETANQQTVSFVFGDTEDVVDAAPMTENTHRNKNGIPQDQGLLDKIVLQQPFVSLTDKKVYVPTSSDEFSITKISAVSGVSAENVVMSVISANGSSSASHTYNMIQVSNNTTTGEATYYLKGTSSHKPWDGKYVLFVVGIWESNDVVSLRMGMGDTMVAMTNDYSNNKIATGFTARRWQQAKFVRKRQYASDDVLLEMIKQSPTISITRGGYNDARDIDEWTFDVPQRKISIRKGNSFGSGSPITTSEYYFEIYKNDVSKLETGLYLNSYGTGGGGVAAYSYFKMSTEPHRRDNFVSMNYSATESLAADIATNQQFALTHPLWRNISKATLSMATLTNMVPNRQWVPVNASAAIQAGTAYMSTNFAAYAHNTAPGGAWRDNLSLRVQQVNTSGAWQGNFDRYVPVPYQYNGPYDTILMLERVTNAFPNTHKDKFVAIRVGTGINSYTAKIGYGNTLQDALSQREALTHWNYRPIEGTGTVDVENYLRANSRWGGRPYLDGAPIGGMWVQYESSTAQYGTLIGIQGPGDPQGQHIPYQLELVYRFDNPESNGVVFKLIGYGQYGGKFIRFNKKTGTADGSRIKMVLGSDEAGVNASWSAAPANNFESGLNVIP
ncbi:hypothetical protein SAMN02745150_01042 [Brevinema andersonii]|uniref:Cadherin-like beta sandwich domain-containing protein n=1 Tax=Brevinema andersonii TaxID=34097 RepID=A0A1I1EB83_BREAD|nr:hypothetical protein [Brevinema andersonii]SFB84361.1 hypothetical protein SAMN02745150_01042 [Brevinema andersonii]